MTDGEDGEPKDPEDAGRRIAEALDSDENRRRLAGAIRLPILEVVNEQKRLYQLDPPPIGPWEPFEAHCQKIRDQAFENILGRRAAKKNGESS